jgi:hypothetical protein
MKSSRAKVSSGTPRTISVPLSQVTKPMPRGYTTDDFWRDRRDGSSTDEARTSEYDRFEDLARKLAKTPKAKRRD